VGLGGRQRTAGGGAFREKNDWVVQVIPQQTIKAMRVLSETLSKNSDLAAGAGMELFTTALGLYGGVLWSGGELQRCILHEMMPT
jgi:hypothetical protein